MGIQVGSACQAISSMHIGNNPNGGNRFKSLLTREGFLVAGFALRRQLLTLSVLIRVGMFLIPINLLRESFNRRSKSRDLSSHCFKVLVVSFEKFIFFLDDFEPGWYPRSLRIKFNLPFGPESTHVLLSSIIMILNIRRGIIQFPLHVGVHLVNGTSRRALGGMFLLKKVLEQNGTTFEVLTKAGIRQKCVS